MGFGFRKSFKIGKNTRVNLSKTGKVGISTGAKGARASINNQGTRSQISKGGIYYRTQKGFKSNTQSIFLTLAVLSSFLIIFHPLMFLVSMVLWIIGFESKDKGGN